MAIVGESYERACSKNFMSTNCYKIDKDIEEDKMRMEKMRMERNTTKNITTMSMNMNVIIKIKLKVCTNYSYTPIS